jgi:hypothetical protein
LVSRLSDGAIKKTFVFSREDSINSLHETVKLIMAIKGRRIFFIHTSKIIHPPTNRSIET